MKIAYVNNTSQDVRAFHAVIMDAIINGGVFGDDYADIFELVASPAGSDIPWILQMA